MDGDTPVAAVPPPGSERTRRFRPRLRYELIDCGLHGHELLGIEAAALRPEDAIFAREAGGLRWYRCLRCDSWLPLSPPDHPTRPHPPQRSEVRLPLRGRPLRDRYVLRLVALERLLHFLVLSVLAAAVFVFASNKAALDTDFTRALKYVQGGLGGPITNTNNGIVHDLQRLFGFSVTNLYLAGTAIAAYAVLEGVEAVGLWFGRRWAEYLTFVSTTIFVPYEIYELAKGFSALKVVALALNLIVVAYLLIDKRLFGLRGGGKAEQAEHDAETGWPPIERATPAPSTSFPATPGNAAA